MIENCKKLFMVRTASWKFLIGIVLLHALMTTFFNLVVFRLKWLQAIQLGTGGYVSGTLVANAVFLLVVVGLILTVGKLKPKDLALSPIKGFGDSSLLRGIMWTAIGFVLMHLSIAAYSLLARAEIVVQNGNLGTSIGHSLGQFFGNALYEEILFRAFLITQMLVLIKKKKRKWSWNRCFLIALLGSQVIFALIHIPNRLYQGSYTGVGSFFADQFILVILGSLLAGVFLLSRNVYAAIGIHALVNKAAVFFVLPSEDLKLSAFLVIPLMILANRMKAKSKKKDEKA